MIPIDPSTFAALFPGCPQSKRAIYLPHFVAACEEAGITTEPRLAAFAAQLGHESNDLAWFEEFADGSRYEGRRDLGNVQPGDGCRYKGRGPIQLTGRANYRAAGSALGVDLEGNPERACDPDIGFRTAAWYWRTHGLNELADRGEFTAITQRINGGQNGAADRVRRLHRAVGAIGGVA